MKRIGLIVVGVLCVSVAFGGAQPVSPRDGVRVRLLPGEHWWGGATYAGREQPFSAAAEYPGHGWEMVRDQFLMGETLLVAPQVDEGAESRSVIIPPGTWTADDGTTVIGPKTIVVRTPLARLPHFVRSSEPGK